MYYDDEARRFNFLSGLLLGVALGTGLVLLAGPPRRSPRRIRAAAERLRERAGSGAEEARGRARSAARSAVSRVRSAADGVGR